MDHIRQKVKKEKSSKHHDKAKPQSFMADVRTLKETLKIKEILKTVKINSSMRIKAPRGSKVMSNKDLSESNEQDSNDDFGFTASGVTTVQSDKTNLAELSTTQASNLIDIDSENDSSVPIDAVNNSDEIDFTKDIEESIRSIDDVISNLADELNGLESNESIKAENFGQDIKEEFDHKTKYSSHETIPRTQIQADTLSCLPTISSLDKLRTRKLSLDHTMLTRRPSLSQSEMNLNSVGKSPLERKSSFFRKKMESFFRNTSEVFKRQSLGKAGELPGLPRRGSISCSLQSLHDTGESSNKYLTPSTSQEMSMGNGSMSSLNSTSTMAYSSSSYTGNHQGGLRQRTPDQLSLTDSPPIISASQPLGDWSESAHNLNEAYIQEQMFNSRAISMSSGLDSAQGTQKRVSSLANRVTWLASEGLTNYLRRVIQDEKSKEIQVCQSFNHFHTLPGAKAQADLRGRRLSYQRAVSGEDPIKRASGSVSLTRRYLIPGHHEVNYDLVNLLAEFTRNGVPPLKGFSLAPISDQAWSYLQWAEKPVNLDEPYDWRSLQPNEEARQAVIKELVSTEADYIRHLSSIVEVFMASAHALQDCGKLLEVDTERLFLNVPDVLNASLCFWEAAFCPMVVNACENHTIYNTDIMYPGFYRFREFFHPYEKFVSEQNQVLDYLRTLHTNSDFMMYLSWCHSQRSCNRLQLSDMIVKPMQRLTKYGLILRRIISHTEAEPERTSLIAMETFTKNYVLDLNRSIRQREELEKLDALTEMIDVYEVEFKDEELDKLFRAHSSLNLRAPMVGCAPNHSRSLIYQGDLRFKDTVKEIEVRAFLLTDMILICKKLNVKGQSSFSYKLIRPKYMTEKFVYYPQMSKTKSQEIVALMFVMLDEVGSAYTCFALTESSNSKEPASQVLKMWDIKLREARLTYDLGVWYTQNPSRDITDADSFSDYINPRTATTAQGKQSSEDLNIEREARERVAAMMYRSAPASIDYDYSQTSIVTDSFDGEPSGASGLRGPGLPSMRNPIKRASTGGSSRNSRLSSFQQSTSAASHDEPQAGPSRNIYCAGSSVEHLIPPQHPNEEVTSITVNVVSESESETMVPKPLPPAASRPTSRSSSTSKQHTLKVQPASGVMALVHSLPDLTLDPSPRTEKRESPSPKSASEKLYQSHHELLSRNRLAARTPNRFLTPDHRGTSYPPPSPTRASLKRSLAIQQSFRKANPPLAKMGHVNSQSQLPAEASADGASTSADPSTSDGHSTSAGPSTSTGPNTSAGPSTSARTLTTEERGAINPLLVPSTSLGNFKLKLQHQETRKENKQSSKLVSSRRKGKKASSPNRKEGD